MDTDADGVYKFKQGQKEYDNFYNAVTIAEAKAVEEDRTITICRKLLNTFEPVAHVHPDGSRERLEDRSDHTTF